MRRWILAAVILSGVATAQEFPKYEVSAGLSYGSMDTAAATRSYTQGWLGSFGANLSRWVGVEAQASSQYNSETLFIQSRPYALSPQSYAFLAGPRFAYRVRRMAPFVHGLAGVMRTLDYGQATLSAGNTGVFVPYQNAFGGAVGGGFDYALSRHIALRTQTDYLLSRNNIGLGTTRNFRTIAGVVFTFGGDSVEAERAALRDKLTRLAKARESSVVPGSQPAFATAPAVDDPSKALPPLPEKEAPPEPVAQPRAATQVVVAENSPAPAPAPVAVPGKPLPSSATTDSVAPAPAVSYSPATSDVHGVYEKQELSLGEIARQYRARKRQQASSNARQ